jgi:hypothetical protein
VLQKKYVDINIFKLIFQQKKKFNLRSVCEKNIHNCHDKNNKDNNLRKSNFEVPIPTIQDMEFSWSENYE